MLKPIVDYHRQRLSHLPVKALLQELEWLRNPSTTNRITLAIIKWQVGYIEELLQEKQQEIDRESAAQLTQDSEKMKEAERSQNGLR